MRQRVLKLKSLGNFFKDWTTALTVFFIAAMSVFNVLFIAILNQSGQEYVFNVFDVSKFAGEQDDSLYSAGGAVYGNNPIDIESIGASEEELIVIENAALLNANNPLSNIMSTRGGVIIYKVQKGDTVSRIASNFGISVNTILWANGNLKPNSLLPGQEIIILPVTGVLHSIQEGETLDDIANKYGILVSQILSANPTISSAKLAFGMTIVIPNSKPLSTSAYSSMSKLPDLPGYFAIPTTGWNWGQLHPYNAVDIANGCGTPVYVAAEGLAIEAASGGWNFGYGNYIVIEHPNGTKTKYAHNFKIMASVGDYVVKGDQIATIGNTGFTHGPTGCHLHFEVYGARNPFAK